MANELRVRQNFLGGKVDDNPLTSGATTLTSSALAAMVAIGSTQHLPIILDPDAIFGAPEVVYVTAHTASATTATILRGQESTTARAHQQDVDWVHGATVLDFGAHPEITGATVATSETTTSTTYTDLTTSGPAVTMTVGPSGSVLLTLSADMVNNTINQYALMGYAVSGATTTAAADTRALLVNTAFAGQEAAFSRVFRITGLTPGSTTFTAKYRVTAGTGTFIGRELIVIPI